MLNKLMIVGGLSIAGLWVASMVLDLADIEEEEGFGLDDVVAALSSAVVIVVGAKALGKRIS